MKAVLCKSLVGPSALKLETLEDPEASSDEVIVAVEACALNFFDTLITRGKYQFKPDLPFSPGGEIAGRIIEVGSNVAGWKLGDRVTTYIGWGGAREKIAVTPERLVAIPQGVSSEAASATSITYGTAIHGLRDRAGLQSGDRVAVLGASGGAGLAAVELASAMGARVIAVASSEEKLQVCRQHGAEQTVDYVTSDLKSSLRALTDGRGVDIVYDCIGGKSSEAALRAMAWGGRFLVVGFASGDIPRIPLNLLLLKGCAAIGVFWGEAVKRNPAAHRANMASVLNWVATGALKARIDRVYPLEDTAEALRMIEQRKVVGKILLTTATT